MNVRKSTDYSAMFTALDALMAEDPPQMELYCEIGRLVSGRPEKGAAVAAAEYLCSGYPDASGFSPRNLRRMRDFYRTYENTPDVLAEAVTISWTQNVVILEAKLTVQERMWYIRAAGKFGWSKIELQRNIAACTHLETTLDIPGEVRYSEEDPSTNIPADNSCHQIHRCLQDVPACRCTCEIRLTVSTYNDIIGLILSRDNLGNNIKMGGDMCGTDRIRKRDRQNH